MSEKVHSYCLPYYDCFGRYVSYFDLEGKEHMISPEKFKDVTTDGGRLRNFHTFEVQNGGKRLTGMRYKIKVWVPVEPEEPEIYERRLDALVELRNLRRMQPENIYKIVKVLEDNG